LNSFIVSFLKEEGFDILLNPNSKIPIEAESLLEEKLPKGKSEALRFISNAPVNLGLSKQLLLGGKK
jgi:hypothetical protein